MEDVTPPAPQPSPSDPPESKSAQASPEDSKSQQENNHQRKIWLLITLLFFVLIGAGMALMWLFVWQYEESTEDAYVGGNIVRLSSQISASIVNIYTDDTYLVDEGKLIVLLDDTMTRVSLEQAQAALAQAVRKVTQLFEDVSQSIANVEVQQVQLLLAKQEYDRRIALVKTSGVSVEDLENASTRYEVAKANLVYAKSQLEAAVAQVQGTTIDNHPTVELAKAGVRSAYVNQVWTRIYSPVKGYVAKRMAQVGQWVNPGNALMAIVPLFDIWVDANFKETQLKNMRIGQDVEITADTYGGDVVYHGKLVGISAGSGDVFDILPPQNATGNWIKIVQRVPVRVSLDPKELEKHPLRLGLSTTVTVKTRDLSGRRLAEVPTKGAIYTTMIFEDQAAKAEAMIEEIVQRNKVKLPL